MQGILDNIGHFVRTWGTNPLVDLVAGSLLTLIAVFFRRIGWVFSRIATWFRFTIRKQRKDYIFEKAYLNWIIERHRYLGLLPARLVTARWGEGRRIVDMEKVYVTLQVSMQGGDQGRTETYSREPSSWRKQPRFYPLLKNYYFWLGIFLPSFTIILLLTNFLFHFSLSLSFAVSSPLILLLLLLFLIRRRILREEK